ncbi:hypothetical protein, partial [Vreelandella lionensis]|uniref:hypothetical protein n=1 Tax=Vreelandella lionensis TaxID=1144478 RepID=UPI001A9D37DB
LPASPGKQKAGPNDGPVFIYHARTHHRAPALTPGDSTSSPLPLPPLPPKLISYPVPEFQTVLKVCL